ncbi:MAG: LD-carboxypeptidase, partial [Alphaproteobacteria bacterium]|nr:LD-carboxypeptidase [Alphaproteobacteria bacterium]
SILLIEDECESSYKISLMLTQLKYNPRFKEVKGIVVGRFSDCADHPTQGSMAEVIADFAAQVNVPMIMDFNFGHFRERYVLPAGVKYRLDADACRLEQLEDL